MPPTLDMRPDVRVYAFLVASTLFAGIVAGLAPARYGVRGDLSAPLKGGATGAGPSRPGRTRATLVGVQTAASIVLLVLAALLTRSMVRVISVELGFDDARLVVVSPNFQAAGYDEAQAAAYWDQAIERLARMPGVEHAAVVDLAPFALGSGYGRSVTTQFEDGEAVVFQYGTGAGYFNTSGTPLLRGRAYTAAEVASEAPVAVVSEALAQRLWPGAEAFGATLEVLHERFADVRVIGIAADAVTNSRQLDEAVPMTFYMPFDRDDSLVGQLLVRTAGDAGTALPSVHEAVRALDPRLLPITVPVRHGVQEALGTLRGFLLMATLLGAVALGLAITGVFGLTAFAVEQRTSEIGVRMALGAGGRDVMRLMLRDSLRPVAVGLAVGLLGALAGSRVLTSYLYGVSPRDPLAMATAVAVLLVAASVAASVPTRRATLVDPANVLRRD